jgi:AcrR family transcriptional regulator
VSVSASRTKALRSDAQRNRDRLVQSARELIAREGPDVSVEEITQNAGLGMGTLYRHFPTKEELIDAVLEDAFAGLVALARQAAVEEDAWTGLTRFLEQALARHAANRGLKDVLPRHARWPTVSQASCAFGPPISLTGNDYAALADQVRRGLESL